MEKGRGLAGGEVDWQLHETNDISGHVKALVFGSTPIDPHALLLLLLLLLLLQRQPSVCLIPVELFLLKPEFGKKYGK
jgi:hypothetical protein